MLAYQVNRSHYIWLLTVMKNASVRESMSWTGFSAGG
jgi:hypothetical protein